MAKTSWTAALGAINHCERLLMEYHINDDFYPPHVPDDDQGHSHDFHAGTHGVDYHAVVSGDVHDAFSDSTIHHTGDLEHPHSESHPHYAWGGQWHSPLSEAHWGSSMLSTEHFNVDYSHQDVHGEPATDMAFWHQQTHPDTCAVVSQEFVLDSMGLHIPEDQLRTEAMAYGLYTPGGGTPLDAMGDLLQIHGIPIEKEAGASLDDIQSALDHHEKVIVAIHAEDIWHPQSSEQSPVDFWQDPFGLSGHVANHAVEVIGIDRSDPAHPQVVLNDPGAQDGQGSLIPADQFMHAWRGSNNYMVHTVTADAAVAPSAASPLTPAVPVPAPPIWNYAPALAGYENKDGTYHYSSDNTDRDPETGKIVRQW